MHINAAYVSAFSFATGFYDTWLLHILPIYFSAPPAAKRRGGPGGLSKICGVSPELQAIVGEPAMPRTQVFYQPSSFFIIIFLVYI